MGFASSAPTYQSKRHVEEPWLFEWFTKVSAVCRAGRRVKRSRCAVRMTAKGSARPGMACRDRPAKIGPQSGAFPAVGIPPRSGGQIGVWTGLIIPAPIWREGRDSPIGLRSHGWRSEAFSPLARRRSPQVNRSPMPARRNRLNPNQESGVGNRHLRVEIRPSGAKPYADCQRQT